MKNLLVLFLIVVSCNYANEVFCQIAPTHDDQQIHTEALTGISPNNSYITIPGEEKMATKAQDVRLYKKTDLSTWGTQQSELFDGKMFKTDIIDGLIVYNIGFGQINCNNSLINVSPGFYVFTNCKSGFNEPIRLNDQQCENTPSGRILPENSMFIKGDMFYLQTEGLFCYDGNQMLKTSTNSLDNDFFEKSNSDQNQANINSASKSDVVAANYSPSAAEAWNTAGNNISDGFFGTTNTGYPVKFKSMNLPAGRLDIEHTAFGLYALQNSTSEANNNSAFGKYALQANTTGTDNNAFGENSLNDNVTGRFNNAFGAAALCENTGNNNDAFGYYALKHNTVGEYNCAFGFNAGRYYSTSSINQLSDKSIFIGANTKSMAADQTNEIVIGYDATGAGSHTMTLGKDVTKYKFRNILYEFPSSQGVAGQVLTNMGSGVLSWTTVSGGGSTNAWSLIGNTGTTSTDFIGTTDAKPLVIKTNNTERLRVYSTATNNNIATITGGDLNVNGLTVGKGGGQIYNNTAIGGGSLKDNTTGYQNTAVGYQSLFYNNDGRYNTAIGDGSMYSNTTGGFNTAVGVRSLYKNNTGTSNLAFGYFAMYENTIGSNNTAIGVQSIYKNISGSLNTAIGYFSLEENIDGTGNTAIGTRSIRKLTSGSYNIAVGTNAGEFLAGGSLINSNSNNSIFLGVNTKASALNQTNEIVIGYDATGAGSNTMTLGHLVTKYKFRGILYEFPSTQGSSGQVLTNNGSGVLSWSNVVNTAWNLSGNANTDEGKNFIGTTDLKSLIFRTNSLERMRITSNGYVGVGVMDPSAPLTVSRRIKVTGFDMGVQTAADVLLTADFKLNEKSQVGGTGIYTVNSGFNMYFGNPPSSAGRFVINRYKGLEFTEKVNDPNIEGVENLFMIANNKFVGIGTPEPQAKLHINGNLIINELALTSDDRYVLTTDDRGLVNKRLISEIGATSKVWMLEGNDIDPARHFLGSKNSAPVIFKTSGREQMRINELGIIGIGTSEYPLDGKGDMGSEEPVMNTDNYRLFVEDGIRTRKIKVDLRRWADNVFEENYKLMPLSDLENYISINKHLPGIPTSEVVLQQGVELGEMNVILLEKIEELTLHSIEINNKNTELQKQNLNQQQVIDNLIKRVEQLEEKANK